MKSGKRTSTEATAITAIAVGVSLLVNGSYVASGTAFVMGISLLLIYEHYGIENLKATEGQIQKAVSDVEDTVEESTE